MVALAVHAQQLDGRLERLERRLDTIEDDLVDANERTDQQPTHGDLLEVRMHSARVAAELARVRVALRAEIDELGETMADAQAETERRARRDDRIRTFAEQVLDLSDAIDTQPADVDLRDAS